MSRDLTDQQMQHDPSWMPRMTDYDPLSSPAAERGYAEAQRYRDILDRLQNNEAVREVPWGNPNFQLMCTKRLAKIAEYKRDSDDLAVITRVFGGKK